MRLGFIPNWLKCKDLSATFLYAGGSVWKKRGTSKATSPPVRMLCDRVHHAKNSNRQGSGRQATVPVESLIHFNREGMKVLIVLHLTMQCKCSSIALQGMGGKKEIMTCRVN